MTELTLDRIPQGWDEASDGYDRIAFPITSRYARSGLEIMGVSEGDRLLDVAAGTGAASISAAEMGAEVVATDFSPKMIERLRARMAEAGTTEIETMVMDGQDLKFADSTFDKCISVFGLIFFPDRSKGFREMWRVLRPGGKAAVLSWSVPERTWPLSVWGMTLRELLPDLPQPKEPPAVYSLKDPEQLKAEMSQAGFQTEVVPVTHTFDAASAEAFWDGWHQASPVFTALQQQLEGRLDEFRESLISKVRERFGDGPVSAESEALVAVGTKPA